MGREEAVACMRRLEVGMEKNPSRAKVALHGPSQSSQLLSVDSFVSGVLLVKNQVM